MIDFLKKNGYRHCGNHALYPERAVEYHKWITDDDDKRIVNIVIHDWKPFEHNKIVVPRSIEVSIYGEQDDETSIRLSFYGMTAEKFERKLTLLEVHCSTVAQLLGFKNK